jgi:group I intron endonuclease
VKQFQYKALVVGTFGNLDSGIPDRSGIYLIRNRHSRKVYVGSALNIRKRLREHQRTLLAGNHKNRHLQAACAKSGIESFRAEIVAFVEPSEATLLAAEILWMERLDCRNNESSYNICPVAGTRRGAVASPETCARIGRAKRGNQNRKGAVVPQEMRDRIAEKLRGRKATAESRANQSKARKGKKPTAEAIERRAAGRRGRPCAAEQRARISATLKGRKVPAEVVAKRSATLRRKRAEGWKRPPVSEETRAAISAKNKGRKLSPETRAKMSAAKKGLSMPDDRKARIAVQMRQIWSARKDGLLHSPVKGRRGKTPRDRDRGSGDS